MKELSFLIKPVSSSCNLHCKYCFYLDVAKNREIESYGIMSRDTAKQLIFAAVKEVQSGDKLSFAFQGGEPSLAGIEFYRFFFKTVSQYAQNIQVNYSFQTNGMVIDDEWCALFRQHNVLVGLSIDANSQFHNACRVDISGHGSYSRVHKSMELMKRTGVKFNILSVITANCSRHPTAVWKWLQKEEIEYVQFIPCLDTLGSANCSPWALHPSQFCDFYRAIFSMWKRNLENGHFISIKLFDDLINLYFVGETTACGFSGHCTIQYVIEANGDVFPCDFYVLDQYKMGSILHDRLSKMFSCGKQFLTDGREYTLKEPCRSCTYLKRCGGGCKRMQSNMYFDNETCYFAKLLDDILIPLLTVARGYIFANNFLHNGSR